MFGLLFFGFKMRYATETRRSLPFHVLALVHYALLSTPSFFSQLISQRIYLIANVNDRNTATKNDILKSEINEKRNILTYLTKYSTRLTFFRLILIPDSIFSLSKTTG